VLHNTSDVFIEAEGTNDKHYFCPKQFFKIICAPTSQHERIAVASVIVARDPTPLSDSLGRRLNSLYPYSMDSAMSDSMSPPFSQAKEGNAKHSLEDDTTNLDSKPPAKKPRRKKRSLEAADSSNSTST
jgi:hypothetical protein